MEKQNYRAFLIGAMESINDCLGAEFTAEDVILQCFQTENKEKVFKEFCTTYFPYRLADDYKAEDYFEFRASAFVGKDNGGIDGIMLRTDIDYSPNELHHVFLHELAHIFCVHNELEGQNFYDQYCLDYAHTKEEDGIINAGYAVWREVIAEVIAIECDEAYQIQPLKRKLTYIQDYMDHVDPLSGKLFMSMILTEITHISPDYQQRHIPCSIHLLEIKSENPSDITPFFFFVSHNGSHYTTIIYFGQVAFWTKSDREVWRNWVLTQELCEF